MDQQLASIESRLGRLEDGLHSIDNTIDHLGEVVSQMAARLERIDRAIGGLRGDGSLGEILDALNTLVDRTSK